MPYKDPEKYKEYQRAYRRANAEQRAAERPDYDRSRHANQRAAAYGVQGRITVHDVRAVLAAGKCFYCGSTERLGIDHVKPLNEGGANEVSNLVACCHGCNSSKRRGDRPGRWSLLHDACIRCGTTERRHIARGMCSPCYQADRKATAKLAGDVTRILAARPT